MPRYRDAIKHLRSNGARYDDILRACGGKFSSKDLNNFIAKKNGNRQMTPAVLAILQGIDEAYGGPGSILGPELSLQNDASGTLETILKLSASEIDITRWGFPIVGTYIGLVERNGFVFAVLDIERIDGFLQYRLRCEWWNLGAPKTGAEERGVAWCSGKITNLLGQLVPQPSEILSTSPIIRRWQLYAPDTREKTQFWLKGIHQFVGDGDRIHVDEAAYFCQVPKIVDRDGIVRLNGHPIESILGWEGWRIDSRFAMRFDQFIHFCDKYIQISDVRRYFSPKLPDFEQRR